MKKPVVNISSILDQIRNKAAELLPAGSRLALFGSRAQGSFREDSDWDLNILIPGEENLSLSIISRYAYPLECLGWELNQDFSVMVYSYKGWEKRNFLPFYKNVENDKIILFQN